MAFDQLMGVAQRLNVSVEALATLAAELQFRAGGEVGDAAVRDRVAAVAASLGIGDIDGLTPDELRAGVGAIKAFFLQAAELVEHPERPSGWMTEDPTILQSQGRASMMVASLLGQVMDQLSGLGGRLATDGAAFLDVGTGVGWLAIAMAQAHPQLRVVGLDVYAPSLALAERNVAGSGVADRVDLRNQDASTFDEVGSFDLAWVPAPFLPAGVVPAILDRVCAAMRPGGWVTFGLYAAPPEPLAVSLNELRIVRSGGHPWSVEEAATLLEAAGFDDVSAIERTWNAPIQFVVGRATGG